jgi:hypothetical protein
MKYIPLEVLVQNVKKILFLVAIVTDYYRCTTCGHDTRQYVNGSIKYIKLQEDEIEWLKNQSSE